MRLRVLCEDRKTENLIRRLCEAWGLSRRDVHVQVAPSARGAASAWVRESYAAALRTFRGLASFQPELGMLVVIDGDNVGVEGRERELARRLASEETKKGTPGPRGAEERVALFVPTWSVETWLLWLMGDRSVRETESYKQDPRVASIGVERETGAALAAFLRGADPGLPSLEAARAEARRLPWERG